MRTGPVGFTAEETVDVLDLDLDRASTGWEEIEPHREESETKRLRAALEQATAVNRELAQRLESLAGADAVAALAGGLLRSVFRP